MYFSPHMLRHTFARMALDAKVNLFALKEIMGHSDISTTQRYLSISKESQKSKCLRLIFEFDEAQFINKMNVPDGHWHILKKLCDYR